MNSQKTICQNLKWLFLPVAFLVFGFFGLGIGSAKAEIVMENDAFEISGSTITFSKDVDLFICSKGMSTSYGFSFSLNNSIFSTDLGTANYGIGKGYEFKIDYITDISANTYSFNFDDGTYQSPLACIALNGVDTSVDPTFEYLYFRDRSQNRNLIVPDIMDNNFIVFGGIRADLASGVISFNDQEDSLMGGYGDSYASSYFLFPPTDTEDKVFVPNITGSNVDVSYSVIELVSSEPEVYLISETEDLYLQFNPLLNFCPTNTSCLLNYVYDTALFSNSADFLKVWYYETSTSTPTYLGIQPLATKWEFDILGSGYLIASSTTSTDQFSYYRVQPCQFNYPYACAGTSTVAFRFIEQKDPIEEIENILNAPGNETIAKNQGGIITINPKEIACTQEEWDTPDPVIGIDWLNATTSVPALNFTKHVCNIKAGLIAIPIATGNVFKNWWEKTGDYISKIFPFGIIKNISNSWTNSASSTLPVALEWLVPVDESGNITMTIPASFIKQATSSELVVFGPDLADSNASWTEFATKIRGITTYLLWAGFLWGLYLFGIKIYNEIRE